MKDWIYNEFNHVGVDYSDKSNTDIYDNQMKKFRNYKKETEILINSLGIIDTKKLTAIDIGCGTGAFAVNASGYFNKIYAVDVSYEMLKAATIKAEKKGIKNIEFINSGFLSFQPEEEADVVFTKWAFHHLPDYWKQAGLLNINKMLKMDGILFLSDVIFKFDPEYDRNIESLLIKLQKDFSSDFIKETKIHIRDEYSTFDWIIQGLIERAGFKIEKSNTNDILLSDYLCRKIKSF